MSRIPTRKQYELLRVCVRFATVLVPPKREFGPLASHGWTEDAPECDIREVGRGVIQPQRITPAGLRALADAMERYEGEGGDDA